MSSAERILLLSVGMLLWCILSRRRWPLAPEDPQTGLSPLKAAQKLILWLVVGIGVASWWGLPPQFAKRHYWDLYHYYIGAKYFDEIGYTGLYNCSLRADKESEVPSTYSSLSMRDLASNTFITHEQGLYLSQECRSQFSATRWEHFKGDVLWFRSKMGDRWTTIFNDHGFNPSPWWIWVARWLIPDSSVDDDSINRLVALDLGLIALMWLVALVTWDVRVVAVAAIVWGGNPLANGSWTAGGFLRHDWICASLAGLALLTRARASLAGALFAYAAWVRVFPALLLVGALLYRGSILRTDVKRIMLGAGVSSAIILSLTVGNFGVAAWQGFASNTTKHVGTRGGNLVGLGHVVDHIVQCQLVVDNVKNGVCAPPERIEDAPLGWIKRCTVLSCGLIFFGWLVWWSRQVSLAESVMVSVLALPLLTSPSSYYYEILILPTLLAARSVGVGIVMLSVSILLQLASISVSPPNKVYLVASVILAQAVVVLCLTLSAVRGTATKVR